MHVLVLLALLAAPSHAGIALRWGPALDQTLVDVKGPGQEIVRGFDGEVLRGLGVRINEIDALAQVGVNDLDSLRRFRRLPDAGSTVVPVGHLAALERSLEILSPIISRLEARGVRLDQRALPSLDLAPLLSQALIAEAREAERLARRLAAHYDDERASLESALAESEEADSLLRDRYPYLSPDALDRLARVYDSGRTRMLAATRAKAAREEVAMVGPEERSALRDSVAEPRPKSVLQRLAGLFRAVGSRTSRPPN